MEKNAKVTLQDLADYLHTTRATVSRALSGHPGISAAMKARTARAAQKLGYRHNRIAMSLRKGKSFVVGVLIPSAEISFFGSIVHGIDHIADQNGYSILLIQTGESEIQEQKGVETLLSLKVDGILASLTKETKNISHFRNAQEAGTPVVLFDRVGGDDTDIPAIVNDDFRGAYEATRHLIGQGFRRIVHIGGPQYFPVFKERYNGYLAALEEADIQMQPDWFYEGNLSITSGETAMQHLLSSGTDFNAVFAVEDYTALGCLNALKDAGKSIPEEVAVIGFANELFGHYVTPTLSTMDQQTRLMGEEAMRMLLEVLNNGPIPGGIRRKIIPVKPVYRQSSLKNNDQ